MKKNLTTPAGPTEPPRAPTDDYVNALNQVFAIFRRNYHNQYYKALPNEKELSLTKRLWLESLQRFSPETILKGCKAVIESSEYLPTLRTMIYHCEQQHHQGLPDPHSAYREACRAPSPKSEFAWSHIAVYHAGKDCDWYFLQSSSEDTAFPVFKKAYEKVCQRVRQGEVLAQPKQLALPEKPLTTLDKTSNLERLKSLKESLGDL